MSRNSNPARAAAYPPNWREIASAVKDRAHWRCQECERQCYRPGEPVVSMANVLTVHHRRGTVAGHDDENLIALCAPCHLRADLPLHQAHAALTRWEKRHKDHIPMFLDDRGVGVDTPFLDVLGEVAP